MARGQATRNGREARRVTVAVLHPALKVNAPDVSLSRDAEGLAAALEELGVECRFNVRAMRHEFRERGGDWREANDRTEAKLQETIAAKFTTGEKNAPLCFGRETWARALNALLADREVDPFVEWLESLPAWDRTPRLDTWLATAFTTTPECPLTAWAGQFLFLGAATRAFEPGKKLDEMPVLIGPQGCGKSTALRLALPPDRPEWFADGLHLAADPKARAEALQGRVIVEAAEMAGSTRAELESLKSFLSRQDDGSIRLAYRRNPETMQRRCIIAGTANDAHCLPNDPTGNRRFVPIHVAKRSELTQCEECGDDRLHEGDCAACGNEQPLAVEALRRYLNKHREQLWAEAVKLYRLGVEARLPAHLAGAQAAATEEARRRDDLLEDAVAKWLETAPQSFTLADAATGCGLADPDRVTRLPMRDQRRLGAALRAEGYSSRREREGGQRLTLWERA